MESEKEVIIKRLKIIYRVDKSDEKKFKIFIEKGWCQLFKIIIHSLKLLSSSTQ